MSVTYNKTILNPPPPVLVLQLNPIAEPLPPNPSILAPVVQVSTPEVVNYVSPGFPDSTSVQINRFTSQAATNAMFGIVPVQPQNGPLIDPYAPEAAQNTYVDYNPR